jgi:hypothetical protein
MISVYTVFVCVWKKNSENFDCKRKTETVVHSIGASVWLKKKNQWHDNPWERSPNLWIKA